MCDKWWGCCNHYLSLGTCVSTTVRVIWWARRHFINKSITCLCFNHSSSRQSKVGCEKCTHWWHYQSSSSSTFWRLSLSQKILSQSLANKGWFCLQTAVQLCEQGKRSSRSWAAFLSSPWWLIYKTASTAAMIICNQVDLWYVQMENDIYLL